MTYTMDGAAAWPIPNFSNSKSFSSRAPLCPSINLQALAIRGMTNSSVTQWFAPLH